MKIDEVINELTKAKQQYGNIDVKCLVARTCWSTGALIGACIEDIELIRINNKYIIVEGKNIEE